MPNGFQEMIYQAENAYTKSDLVVYRNKRKYLVREFHGTKLVHEYLTDREGAKEEVVYIKSEHKNRWKEYCNGLLRD